MNWATVSPTRVVLVVLHNITTLTRMLDVLPVFDSDFRVQLVATWSGSDPFSHGLREAVEELGMRTIPWEEATRIRFDLAIAASHHGGLAELTTPLMILSHGIGYTKYSPGNRKSEIGNRKSVAGSEVFGVSAEWVLREGEPLAEALVFPHRAQVQHLPAAAVPTAVLAGDPCFDRMRASRGLREHYRRALDARGRTIVAVSSTWSEESLLGSGPELIRRLLAELPVDEYRVVAIVHPNVWHHHGPSEVRRWFKDCLRAGLTLVPEIEGWRASLIAADCVIGDNGSVTAYGAALGKPVLLGAFPDVPPGTAVDVLGELAPRLDPTRPLRVQVDRAVAEHSAGRYQAVTDLVTDAPDESAGLLRELCYRLLDLPAPTSDVVVEPIDVRGLDGGRVTACTVSCEVGDVTHLTRFGIEPQSIEDSHIVAHALHAGRDVRRNADILFRYADESIELEDREIVAVIGDGHARVTSRDGRTWDLYGDGDPSGFPSIVYAWRAAGRELPPRITVETGDLRYELRVSGSTPRTASS
ncbi:hypothetical protein [Allokutzneria albata]|uniref:CDP-Glycerol:Poly(Glycerophosphate) glycerophosphotransferase n=1 Tax=Allokutzneria albata TaxID=211114 RepID=A0A1G9VHZ2_ALLAB|nr:hypothetical protein [Allokutzneria albata]SDM71435.1 hypothetical protein SAMN04489726_3034 [Allokutzneria albata]